MNNPSFPNSIWERNCPRNSVAAFALSSLGSAMELPKQVRSQIEFGNEGILKLQSVHPHE
jgi:hypothetical protein